MTWRKKKRVDAPSTMHFTRSQSDRSIGKIRGCRVGDFHFCRARKFAISRGKKRKRTRKKPRREEKKFNGLPVCAPVACFCASRSPSEKRRSSRIEISANQNYSRALLLFSPGTRWIFDLRIRTTLRTLHLGVRLVILASCEPGRTHLLRSTIGEFLNRDQGRPPAGP